MRVDIDLSTPKMTIEEAKQEICFALGYNNWDGLVTVYNRYDKGEYILQREQDAIKLMNDFNNWEVKCH